VTVATDKAAACIHCYHLRYRWRQGEQKVRCIEGYAPDRPAYELNEPGSMNRNLSRTRECPGFVDMRDEEQGR